MRSIRLVLAAAVVQGLTAFPALAQGEPLDDEGGAKKPAPAEAPKEAAEPAGEGEEAPEGRVQGQGRARLESIVRGFYLQVGVGGGLMLLNNPITPDAFNPGISGEEGYGAGGLANFRLGYDIYTSDFLDVALELTGGGFVASGTRSDQVRDAAVFFGGMNVRAALAITPRLDFLVAAGGAFASVDNAVEESETGPAVVASLGLEYFVHVRHFSVGLDVAMFMPVSPVRMFLAVAPNLKYTF